MENLIFFAVDPLDTGRKLGVLYMFNLRLVSKVTIVWHKFLKTAKNILPQ